MTRYLPQWLSPVVESLELDRPELLTMAELCAIADEAGVKAPGYTIADRLRRLGWLLKTPQRGSGSLCLPRAPARTPLQTPFSQRRHSPFPIPAVVSR